MAKYYHIRVTMLQDEYDEVVFDLDRTTLVERFIEPYSEGRTFVINGRVVDPLRSKRIRIYETDRPSKFFFGDFE